MLFNSRHSWADIPRRISRRFTTLEGFREIGGLYVTGSNIRVFSIHHQFDPENYEDDRTTRELSEKPQALGHLSWGSWKGTPDESTVDAAIDNRVTVTRPETPYHVFSHKESWLVVVMIGVAGLFSGLSSNIYFPALDIIARV
jgi:hypothetical protein